MCKISLFQALSNWRQAKTSKEKAREDQGEERWESLLELL